MGGNDLVRQMAGCLQTVQDADDAAQREGALNTLEEMCEDIDLARDLHKIGGFELLPRVLQDDSAHVRAAACSLVATLVQNNPYCQTEVLKLGLLSQLLNVLDRDHNNQVKVKALYAVSCLTRDVEESQLVFVEHDGFSVLLRAMQTSDERLQTKAAFMMRAMCASRPQFKEVLSNMGLVEQLAALLQTEHSGAHEHITAALLCLVQNNPKAVHECLRPELNLLSYLQSTKKLLEDKEEFLEELEYINQLDKLLTDSAASGVDR